MKKLLLCGLALIALFSCQLTENGNDTQAAGAKESSTRAFAGTVTMNDAQQLVGPVLDPLHIKDATYWINSLYLATDNQGILRYTDQPRPIGNEYVLGYPTRITSYTFEHIAYTQAGWGTSPWKLVGIWKDTNGDYYFVKNITYNINPRQPGYRLQDYIPGLTTILDMQVNAFIIDSNVQAIRIELLVPGQTSGTKRLLLWGTLDAAGEIFMTYFSSTDQAFGGLYTSKCFALERANNLPDSLTSDVYMDGYYYKAFVNAPINNDNGLITSRVGEKLSTDPTGKVKVHGYEKNGTLYPVIPVQLQYIYYFVTANQGYLILSQEGNGGKSLVWLDKAKVIFP